MVIRQINKEELEQLKEGLASAKHELKIESALEKVRTSAMIMKKPAEMPEVCRVIALQLEKLGVKEIRNVQTAIFYEGKGTYMNYEYYAKHKKTFITETGYTNHKVAKAFAAKMLKGKGEFSYTHIKENKVKDWIAYQKTTNVFIDSYLETASSLNYYWHSLGPVALGISTYIPLNEEELSLFKRFLNVFELAYTRYLDIEQAIAQAREAHIQLALERVRARTMAMQKSDELPEAANLLFQQMLSLGMPAWSAGYCIWKEDKKAVTLWMSSEGVLQPPFTAPTTEDELFIQMREGHEKGNTFHVVEMGGEKLAAHYQYMRTLPVVGEILDSIIESGHPLPTFQIMHYAYFSKGYLLFITYEPVPDAHDIFKRFASVFDQTYTRFLDLQKAEAQAREAQIETALERVRSRSMGMQKSEELKVVIQVVYDQFVHLNINIEHTGFVVDYKARDDYDIWIADPLGVPSQVTVPYFDSVYYNRFNEAKEKGEDFFATNLSFDEKNRFYQKLFEYVPGLPEQAKKFYFSCPGLAASTVLLENVCLYIENFSGTPYSDEENNTLMRFGKVFQQTYTRFLDLQKAEAQAREAKIEAALERTRTQSMIMQHSKELDDTLRVFHQQVLLLGIDSAFSFLWLPDEDKGRHIFWAAWVENNSTVFKSKAINYPLGRNEPATAQCLIDWKGNEPVVSYHVPPTGVKNYFAAWQELIAGVEQLKPEYFSDGLYYAEAFMKYGCFGVMVKNELPEEEKKILYRFAIEFERAYTRFLDLQKAEASAREATIEASLERVRSKAMSMHSSEDLADTINVFFKELKIHGVVPRRCGVGLVEEATHIATLTTTTATEQGDTMKVMGNILLKGHPVLESIYENWKLQQEYFPVLSGHELKKYYGVLLKQFDVPEFAEDEIQFGYYFYFKEGSVYAWTDKELEEDDLMLFRKFTSVLSLTYKRYNDLQFAEAQTYKARVEAALERVRARALAMQQPEELTEVAQVMRYEMGLLGVEELETSSIYIHDENTDNAECWYAIKDIRIPEKKLVADHFRLTLPETWVGQQMLTFYHSPSKQISIPMRGANRKEWINYCSKQSKLLDGFYGEDIPDRTYHLYKFSNGTIGAATPGDISSESWDLLSRAASVFSLAYSRFKDLTKARFDLQQLKEEKKRSDSLLLNILPADIAAELKQFGKSYARKHEQVSILFTDIKGFSTISETLSAEELVNQLDECFRAFDHIVGKHGLEKIKTIGDAYICACGLPNPDPDNAVKTVRAALDMLDFAKGFGMTKIIQDLPAFEFRVGIHTGPVITGVVGLKKFTYDIWGDAVNMAARMEQHGEAGRINISGNTYQLIKDKFICTHRGKIAAKNKGEVDMYFVEKKNE
jgi:class 3 adenylate cyclase